MAELLGAFCLPHDPLITAEPHGPAADVAQRVLDAFAQVRRRLEELRVDTVVVVGDDHCAMFHPNCQPRLLIGIGDLEGPLEPEGWLHIPRRAVASNGPLAGHIMARGFAAGFDWAVAKTLVLDHSTMVPIHLGVPASARVVPVYVSTGMTPLISGARCRQLGEMIGQAIASWPGAERVAILGTGGISHWVGMADCGRINETFDRSVLRLVEDGDLDALAALGDDEVVSQAGNGALEIRNWLVALAAVPRARARVLAYEPVPAWITGLGCVAAEAAHA